MTDYGKWNNFEGDSSDDENKIDESSKVSIQLNKRKADDKFVECEKSSSSEYESISLMYDSILRDVENVRLSPDNESFFNELVISCSCNLACCYIRLSKWNESLKLCDGLLAKSFVGKLSQLQLIRVTYFKCHSLVRRLMASNKSVATDKEAKVLNSLVQSMKDILDNNPDMSTLSQMTEYHSLFRAVEELIISSNENQPDQSATIKSSDNSSKANNAPTEEEKVLSIKVSLSDVKQLMLRKQHEKAVALLLTCIAHCNQNNSHTESDATTYDHTEVRDIYGSLAECYTVANKYREAADCLMECANKSFLFAECSEGRKERAGLCVKVAVLYYKLKLHSEARTAYQLAVDILETDMTVHDSGHSRTADAGDVPTTADSTISNIYYIAQTGAAVCFVSLLSDTNTLWSEEIQQVVQGLGSAVAYFERTVFRSLSAVALISGSKGSLFTEVSTLLRHLFTAYDCLAKLLDYLASTAEQQQYGHSLRNGMVRSFSDTLCSRVIDCCNAALFSIDAQLSQQTLLHQKSSRSKKSGSGLGSPEDESRSPENVLIRLLRDKRAHAYVSKAVLYRRHSGDLTNLNVVASAVHNRTTGTATTSAATPSKCDESLDISIGTILSASLKSLLNCNAKCSTSIPQLGKLNTKHTVNASLHTVTFESLTEAVLTYYEYSADELLAIENYLVSFNIQKSAAELYQEVTGVAGFQFDYKGLRGSFGIHGEAVDEHLLEKGHDSWRKVATAASKYADHLLRSQKNTTATAGAVATIGTTAGAVSSTSSSVVTKDSEEVYFYRQQSMLALYTAGLFALHYSNTQAQRAFEAAQTVRDEIDSSQFKTPLLQAASVNSDSSDYVVRRKPVEYFLTCGDLSYHLAQVYLRGGKINYVIQEVAAALHYYHYLEPSAEVATVERSPSLRVLHLPEMYRLNKLKSSGGGNGSSSSSSVEDSTDTPDLDRVRVRQSYALLAVAFSVSERSAECEAVLAHIKAACQGPVEDGEHEVELVRRTIEQKKPKQTLPADTSPSSSSSSSATKQAAPAASSAAKPTFAPNGTQQTTTKQLSPKLNAAAWLKQFLKPYFSYLFRVFTGGRTRNSLTGKPIEVTASDYDDMGSFAILGIVLGLIIGVAIKLYQNYA